MDEKTNQAAALANAAMFDEKDSGRYIEGAPHLKHANLRGLYEALTLRVFSSAKRSTSIPRVLDLGAGEGSATLRFLELGASVTAVDISEKQMAALLHRCQSYGDRLYVRREEITETLKQEGESYDIVVMNSFLHHIPDYLSLIRAAVPLLGRFGQFFSFQDPLRYDTIGLPARLFSQLAYFSWRIFQGNLSRGLKTRIRRLRGIYIPGSPEDDAEYHVTRNGVDQRAIAGLLESAGFDCTTVRYFSTQSGVLQRVGAFLGIENTFAVIAQRK